MLQRAGRARRLETISKLAYTVTPAKAGVQNSSKKLDSGFRRNDDQRHLSPFEIASSSKSPCKAAGEKYLSVTSRPTRFLKPIRSPNLGRFFIARRLTLQAGRMHCKTAGATGLDGAGEQTTTHSVASNCNPHGLMVTLLNQWNL